MSNQHSTTSAKLMTAIDVLNALRPLSLETIITADNAALNQLDSLLRDLLDVTTAERAQRRTHVRPSRPACIAP